MKQFFLENMVSMTLSILLGFSLGFGAVILYSAPRDTSDEYFCFKGELIIYPQDHSRVMGEQMVCAKDWALSNMYGPVGILQDELEKGNDTTLSFKTLDDIRGEYQDKQRKKMNNEGLLKNN
tara:strand:+ start:1542 stop:1907 length:366 start_codon:yes stop_codon:yes gene_type:complete